MHHHQNFMSEKKDYDIFISYHKAQSSEVFKFYRAIRNSGARCWFDQYSGRTHNVFDESLTGIHNSRLFLFFESSEYTKSLRCRVELAIAIEQKMPIINFAFNSAEIISNLNNLLFTQLSSRTKGYLKIDIVKEHVDELFNKVNEDKMKRILNDIDNMMIVEVK